MKRFFSYFVWTVVIGFIMCLGAKYQYQIQQEASATFDTGSVILFASTFPVIIGMLIILPKTIGKWRENKQWTYDWVRFFAIGLPALLILILYVFIPYLPDGVLPLIPQVILFYNSTIQVIAGVVFGYVLLDCVKN